MALCEIHFGSDSLQKQTSMSVIIPEHNVEAFPVLYLLHGLTDDHTGWVRRTSIERYVRDYPLMVVMPDAERGWYTDAAEDPYDAFESLIIRDIISFIDRKFKTIPDRSGRAVCGNSMGGYGALKLALKHPDIFCAAASHSGALTVRPVLEVNEERRREMRIIFGDSFSRGSEDLAEIASQADASLLPPFYMDCGTEDGLLEGNRFMHAHFESLGIRHEYKENPGDHSWAFWDRHIPDSLDFMIKELEIPGR